MTIVPRNSEHNTTAADKAPKQVVQDAKVTDDDQSKKSPAGVTSTRRPILRDSSSNPIPAVQARIPPSGPARIASHVNEVGGSSVTVEGDQLVIEGAGAAGVKFGDDTWADYDLTFEINKSPRPVEMKTKRAPGGGTLGIGARFRQGSLKFYQLLLGAADDRNHLERTAADTRLDFQLLPPYSAILRLSVWHTVKISLRGPHIRVELDGQEIFNATNHYCQKGSVTLNCRGSSGRFRNIKVTAPDGTILWEGLPDLPKE